MEELSDKELVAKYLETGEGEYLEQLIKLSMKGVYNFSLSLVKNESVAEDITQTTFVKVWKNLKKFDQTKSFKSWVFQIAKNTALDYFRTKKAVPVSIFDDEEGNNPVADLMTDGELLPDEIFEKEEEKSKVISAVQKLPETYRELFVLKLAEDLSLEEIAEVFGVSINTIKSRYRRGLMILKKEIET
jgi:RNA polymerase sigma-70 factor (ECF subfamily)